MKLSQQTQNITALNVQATSQDDPQKNIAHQTKTLN